MWASSPSTTKRRPRVGGGALRRPPRLTTANDRRPMPTFPVPAAPPTHPLTRLALRPADQPVGAAESLSAASAFCVSFSTQTSASRAYDRRTQKQIQGQPPVGADGRRQRRRRRRPVVQYYQTVGCRGCVCDKGEKRSRFSGRNQRSVASRGVPVGDKTTCGRRRDGGPTEEPVSSLCRRPVIGASKKTSAERSASADNRPFHQLTHCLRVCLHRDPRRRSRSTASSLEPVFRPALFYAPGQLFFDRQEARSSVTPSKCGGVAAPAPLVVARRWAGWRVSGGYLMRRAGCASATTIDDGAGLCGERKTPARPADVQKTRRAAGGTARPSARRSRSATASVRRRSITAQRSKARTAAVPTVSEKVSAKSVACARSIETVVSGSRRRTPARRSLSRSPTNRGRCRGRPRGQAPDECVQVNQAVPGPPVSRSTADSKLRRSEKQFDGGRRPQSLHDSADALRARYNPESAARPGGGSLAVARLGKECGTTGGTPWW
uniref:Uncharacterized protein n=1 Tax=Plectus sambesii TaxID=2011161 RepID=A0A914X5W8_9BILA